MRGLFLGLLLAGACAPRSAPAPLSPIATCTDVCNNARMLGCAIAVPTATGASCETVCTNFQKGPAPWDLLCRAVAQACATMDLCN